MYVAVTEELCIPVNDYLVFRKGTVLDVHRAKYEKLIIMIKIVTLLCMLASTTSQHPSKIQKQPLQSLRLASSKGFWIQNDSCRTTVHIS